MNLTLKEVDERITALDELIFKVETGQVQMSWEDYRARQIEVDSLMDVLAKNLSGLMGRTYEEVYAAREKVRTLTKLESMAHRHLELHPEDRDKQNPLLIAAFRGGQDGNEVDYQSFERFLMDFDYMFENRPKSPKDERRGRFFARFLSRS